MSNFRVQSPKKSTVSLVSATSWSIYRLFTDAGLVTHLAFDFTGQHHTAIAAGQLSNIFIDVVWNGEKIVDSMTVQHALAFADHFGGAVTYTDPTGADAAYGFRLALPIGCIDVSTDDKLEVTVWDSTDEHAAGSTVTGEIGVVDYYGEYEMGPIHYSRRDIPSNASGVDDRLVADNGVGMVFIWNTSSHVASVRVPNAGSEKRDSFGTPEIFQAGEFADARLSAYASTSFWNKLVRVWSGKGKGVKDSVTVSLTQDATGQNTPIYGVKMSVNMARAMASKRKARVAPVQSNLANQISAVSRG